MKNQKNVTVIKMIEKSEGDISYTYTLFFERSGKVASFGLPLYSIKVEMIKDGVTTERILKEIFSDIGKANVFFEMLADNLATPIDLPYILEDKITV